MKATQKDFPTLAERAAREAKVFFFCGPDEAGASDAADRIVSLIADPGECVEIPGAELKKDPVRLGDEARSSSLFGGSRHIRVRAQGDEVHDAVQTMLEGDVEPCPVLIVATGASDKSRTAKLLVARSDSLVAMFYPPDLRSVTSTVRTMAGAAGLRLGGEQAERIARASGLDTRLARSEITKIALYLDATPESPQVVDGAVLDAVSAATEADDFGPLVDAILGGQRDQLADELRRMREQAMNPVGLLLAFERRCAQLSALSARWHPGDDLEAFLRSERVFWKDIGSIGRQLTIWRGPRLERLARRLVSLHQKLLANSPHAELLLSQSLADIARSAAARIAS